MQEVSIKTKVELSVWAIPELGKFRCLDCFVKYLQNMGNKVLEIDQADNRVLILQAENRNDKI